MAIDLILKHMGLVDATFLYSANHLPCETYAHLYFFLQYAFRSHILAYDYNSMEDNVNNRIIPQIVTPNWLWKCAERWERVEERLFPLTKETEKKVQRVPPLHCSNPDMPWLRPNDMPGELKHFKVFQKCYSCQFWGLFFLLFFFFNQAYSQ